MAQELGETAQEMMQADDKEVQEILNRRPKGHYWIVIAHKPSKFKLDTGERVIMRVCKDYNAKPRSLVGTVVLEVKDGEIIDHEINLPDAPIDWGAVEEKAGLIEDPYVQHRPDIGQAYLYNE
jgi:hypothetical protein